MSARRTAGTSGTYALSTKEKREQRRAINAAIDAEHRRKMAEIQAQNERTMAQIEENNEKIRELLRRAFTSKREGREVSPVVKQQLEKLEKVLLKHKDRNRELLEKIAELLHNAVLLTEQDIKAAKSAESEDTVLRRLTRLIRGAKKRGSPSATRRRSPSDTRRRSPSATSGGRKTRKNRGKKQKTQKRKQHNKRRKQTQRRKQHKKK